MTRPRQQERLWAVAFSLSAGLWLAMALLKFGNPVILDLEAVTARTATSLGTANLQEASPYWSITYGHAFLLLVIISGIRYIHCTGTTLAQAVREGLRNCPWLIWIPLVWLAWQGVAAMDTVGPKLTRASLIHFVSCIAAFFTGMFLLPHLKDWRPFWIPLFLGFLLVLWQGFQQHYGGLEATRQFIYQQPGWESLPREFLLRVASNRIFGTLVYPNALAGAILLLAPPIAVATWTLLARAPHLLQLLLTAIVLYSATACLIWTGSKGGWLIAIGLLVIALLHQPFSKRVRILIAVAIAIAGLAAFFVQFSAYFKKGAPSAIARLDYWTAAWQTGLAHPMNGTGPGTFAIPYAKIKRPESEMARLAHNDYLEQWSDSGLIGTVAYILLIGGALSRFYTNVRHQPTSIEFALWLGTFAWAAQGLIEFGLYIPALAWPAFLFLGFAGKVNPQATHAIASSAPPKNITE